MNKKLQHIILTQIILLLRSQCWTSFSRVRGVFFILFVTGLHITAQTFPVQVIPQVTPPPPVYLSDYASTNNSANRVKAQILLTDLTVLNREVKLKLYIEGNGINTQSHDFVIGAQPIFLDGGIPVQLGSIDLAPYFELQNLQGISAGAYANAIPEGLYQFCFEVYDVLSGNRISNKSCTNVLIFLNDPPFLNLPENNINLEAYNPQNILFQWTPRHINVSNVAYEFSLVEIWDTNVDPQAIFLSSPPIYQITTQATTLLYGLAEPQLLEGKRYAWRVKAQALDGIDEIGLFKNNGYSEIFSFTYQGECNAPSYLTVEEVGTKTATFRWQGEIDHTQYKIDYRKAIDEDGNTGEQNTYHWFESTTNREEFIVIDLEPNTLYEWRVGGYCTDGTLSFAEPSTFTTMAEEAEAYYNCGIEPAINIANQIVLDELQVGDVIKAGDFNVKIQEVSGNGSFSGKGYTTVGFLKNIKIALEFTDIQVNTDYQFVTGEIKTVYDPTWSNILDIDEVIDEFEDIVDVFTGDDIVIITLDYDISVSDITVDTDNGQIVINNPDGSQSTYDYDEGDTYTITDASGDQFEIDANGEVTQTGTGAEGGPARADNTFGISDGHSHNVGDPSVINIEKHPIAFTYRKGSNTKYELDFANNNYENEKYHKVTIDGGGSYYPIHKAILEGSEVDHFYVDVNNISTYIKTDSLIFKTISGTKIDAVKEGTNSYKITVKGRNSYTNEEAIITYKDTLGKQHVLSSFFIHHIKKFPAINVNIVLVNGAQEIDNIQAKLDAIYKPTGVSFNVGNTETLTIANTDWDIDVSNSQIDYNGSGLASDHPKELRAIKDYYKNQNPSYDNKAYHLFVLDNSMPVTKSLAGFMPKKNQWGFLFEAHYSTNIQNKGTISTIAAHELGHGVFALGHPFGENENNSGTANTWLMDYTNGTELAYPNWAKMSDDKLQLHLFQDDEDNEMRGIPYRCISSTISKPTINEHYYTNDGQIVLLNSKYSPVAFVGTSDSYGDKKGALAVIKRIEDGALFFPAKNYTKYPHYYKRLENGTIDINDFIDDFTPGEQNKVLEVLIDNDCKYIIKKNGQEISQGTSVDCKCFSNENNSSEENYCNDFTYYEGEPESDHQQAVNDALINALTNISITYPALERTKGVFKHIQFANFSSIPFDLKKLEMIEDKLHLLTQYKNDTFVVLTFLKVENNHSYNDVQIKQMAQASLDKADLNNKKVAHIIIPYSNNQGYLFTHYNQKCYNINYSQNTEVIANSSITNNRNSLVEDILYLYKNIEKPLYIKRFYLKADGGMDETALGFENIIGYDAIHVLQFYESSYLNEVKTLQSNISSLIANFDDYSTSQQVDDFLEQYNQYKISLSNTYNQAEHNEIDLDVNSNSNTWQIYQPSNLGKLREVYMFNKEISQAYFISQTASFGYGEKFKIYYGFDGQLNNEVHFYDFDVYSVVDPLAYGFADGLSLIPIPYVDNIGDGLGFIYASARGDISQAPFYALGLALPVGAGYLKMGSKGVDNLFAVVAKKADNDEIVFDKKRIKDITSAEVQVTSVLSDKASDAQKVLDELTEESRANIAKYFDEATQTANNFFKFLDDLPTSWTDELKIALKEDIQNEANTAFRNLFSHSNKIDLAEAWKSIRSSIESNPFSGNTTQFALDPNTVNKVADYLSPQNVNKLEAIGGKVELETFLSFHPDVPCTTCGSGGLPVFGNRNLDEMVENYVEVGYNFRNNPLWNKLKQGTQSVNAAMREGTQHTLEIFRKKSNKYAPNNIEDLDLKFESVLDDICANCRYDVKFKSNLGQGFPRLSEFKSYALSTWDGIKNNDKFFKQFKRYLQASEIEKMEDLAYIINQKKTSVNDVKNAFKELLKTKAEELFKPISQGGLGIDRIKQLFGNDIDDLSDFLEKLDDFNSSNSIYRFIKIE